LLTVHFKDRAFIKMGHIKDCYKQNFFDIQEGMVLKRAAVIFLLAVLAAGIFFRVDYQLRPGPALVETEEEFSQPVRVSRGSSLRQIAAQLEERGIINSRLLFEIYILINDYQGNLQAGTYIFSENDDMIQVVDKIRRGDAATFRITIPEGFTLTQITERLANQTDYEIEEIRDSLEDELLDRGYLPDESLVEWRLEGFLFPDTYIIPYDFSPEEILAVMLDRFEREWLAKIEEKIEQQIPANNFEIADYVTIASLIEKEADLAAEKPRIAGVIYNRINQNMRLQLDATVQYVLPERVNRVLYRHLEIDSSYNTYLVEGLPPGPIASPGGESLAAALEPEENDYLYYFALPDGSHVFTRSYQEHLDQQREKLNH